MKIMKDKFIVKTIKKENIEVEGKLITLNDNPLPPRKPSNTKAKQLTLRELIINIDNRFTSEIRNINTRLDKVDSRLDSIDTRLERIENTPTIKKELSFNK